MTPASGDDNDSCGSRRRRRWSRSWSTSSWPTGWRRRSSSRTRSWSR